MNLIIKYGGNMQKQKVVVGIDMGATHIRICVINPQKEILLTQKNKTSEIIGKEFLSGIREFIFHYCSNFDISKIVIGMPAAISKDRQQILSVPNLPIKLEQLNNAIPYLQETFHCSVRLERDVNLQLLYDVHHFNLQEFSVLGVYLGTGLGFAIYQQGNIFVGQNGVAGELGHIPYGNANKKCQCGNYGCLETVCSGRVLQEWYNGEQPTYPFNELFIYALDTKFVQDYLQNLAKSIAMVINLFDPDCIVLGGGVMDMENFPYHQLKQHCLTMIRKPLPYNRIEFYQAQSSDFNGAIGAALRAIL